MCAISTFPDLALSYPENTLDCYIANKVSKSLNLKKSLDDSKQIYLKSSTESDISCDIKMKSESFSSSTDTITPVLLVNEEIIRNLEYCSSKTEKLCILNAILHSQIDSFHYWDLFKILRENLNENDPDIFEITLEIHEKCINSTWEISKDAFINLLETLYLYYCGMECDVFIDRYPYRNAFKIYKLVLNTFKDIFLHLPRYGQNRLEKIIGNFVDLLFVSVTINECSILTPVNMIACLDPSATWCKVLLHGSCTREILFKYIKKNMSFIKYLFFMISDWINDPFVPKSKRRDVIPYSVVKYITFVHCINICNYLSKFKIFYDSFPTSINESKLVISLNSFATSLVSFLKLKNKIIPAQVSHCMIECSVNLLQYQPIDSLSMNIQCILESACNKGMKKNLLEIVRILFSNEGVTQSLINSVIYAKRSRAGLTCDGKLLRPRPNSVVSSRSNIFKMVMDLMLNVLRSNNNQNGLMQIFGLATSILGCHEFYLMLGTSCFLMELMEMLSIKYENYKNDPNFTEEMDNRLTCLEKLLFAIGSTPVGFQFLSKFEILMQLVISKLEKLNESWYFIPWKSTASFIMSSEYERNLNSYYEKLNLEIVELLHQVILTDCTLECDVNILREKIFIGVDSISYYLDGISILLSFDNTQKPENEGRLTSFKEFLNKYALFPNYEYHLQHLALECLKKLLRSINSRIFLLHKLDYEKCLSDIQDNYISSDGEIIIDECSVLRSELLDGNFTLNEDLQTCRDKFSASRNSRKSSAKHTLSRKKLSEIQKFLQETKHGLYDVNWLRQARKYFRSSLTSNIKMSVFLELIEKSAKSIVKPSKVRKFVTAENNTILKLKFEDYKGIELAIRFGIKNHILQQNSLNEENLAQLIRIIRTHCGSKNTEKFQGFDCTLATLFIMCCGSIERSLQIISYIIPLPITAFIWPQVTPSCIEKRYLFGHLLEWLLYQEVPTVYSALSMYGISWWLICKCQLDDCFWNSMDWMNICRWLCITVLYPPDYLMYFFTSVAFKNELKILQTTNENDLRDVLNIIFNTYHLREHLLYIDYLSKKYHFFISSYFMD